jgi:hypothetical protein
MSTTCSICIEEFTKQPGKKQACCPYCTIQACVKCTQTYLLNTQDDPHCMGCRRGWSREVLDTLLLSTWLNETYKKHRENILLDRERSRLPAAQIIIENQKMADERLPNLTRLRNEMDELTRKLHEKTIEFARESQIIENIRRGVGTTREETADKKQRRAFIMPCPATGCRGFLSTAYKCGVCDIYVCPDCREIKGVDKDAAHRCDPNTLESVRTLKRETRPCPECGINIFKIEGCDQMFCTGCHTPFSWMTGQKVTHGAIHNPHYFEYLRAANGGVMPRNPGDIPCAETLPQAWTFDRELARKYPRLSATNTSWLYQALNNITHIRHIEIRNVTNGAEDTDNTEHNIRYLKQEIDEARWKQLLQQREKRRMKRDEIRQRYEAFVGASADIYHRLINTARENNPSNAQSVQVVSNAVNSARDQLMALREIFNQGMIEISRRYKCQVLYLSDKGLARETKKYETGRIRRVKKSDGSTIGSTDDGDTASVTT